MSTTKDRLDQMASCMKKLDSVSREKFGSTAYAYGVLSGTVQAMFVHLPVHHQEHFIETMELVLESANRH
jgi:hypothetical protein